MSENRTGKKPYLKPMMVFEDYRTGELSGSSEIIEQMKRECRELDAGKKELNDRRILIFRAGSIAEATVQMALLEQTTKRQCAAQMLQDAKRKAEDYGRVA